MTCIPLLAALLALLVGSAAPAAAGDGVAVVELFTSEGCSSCPPADRLLSELVEESARDGRAVYPLAFHVDYWDRLGWQDRFAQAPYSERQREYAAHLGERRVYTPQIVVNGRASMVGSNERAVRRALEAALAIPSTITLELDIEEFAPRRIVVSVSLSDSPTPMLIGVAVVERGLTTAVGAGENHGRLLRHDNVVRSFGSAQAVDGAARIALGFSAELEPELSAVIAFAQDPATFGIHGATAVELTGGS